MSAPPVTAGGRYEHDANGSGGEWAGPALKFDWYQATIKPPVEGPDGLDSLGYRYGIDPLAIVGLVADSLGGAHVEGARGMHGYSDQAVIKTADGDTVARVLHGGGNVWPNLWASGDRSPALAALLRQEIPEHFVTRVDVAYDIDQPDGFELLQGVCLDIADARGISVSQAGDWHRLEAGRTLYCGSRASEVFVRLYEKGLEQIGKAPSPAAAEGVSRDWQRLELVVKPHKSPRRAAAAFLEPHELWGYATWTRELAARLWALEIPAVDVSSWTMSDHDKALRWMVKQYGATLAVEAERVGGWDNLGQRLAALIDLS